MKRLTTLSLLFLLLLTACFDPNGGGTAATLVPSWVYDRIYEIENDTIPGVYAHIDHIWRYQYNGSPVYYFDSYYWNDADAFLFNEYGTILARDSYDQHPTDETMLDFYYEGTDGVLLWEYNQWMNYRTPNWVLALIDRVENGTDSTLTNSIWRYDYQGDPVYFLSTSVYQDYYRVYDIYGYYLGAPFGGPRNEGDGLLSDFFEERDNQTFIWQRSNFPMLASDEEYAVINAALADAFSDKDPIHVMNLTDNGYISPDIIEHILENEYVDYDSIMIDQYIQNNSTDHFLNESEFQSPITLISNQELSEIIEDGGWTSYWEQFPNSSDVITMHRPGFDYDSTMAVLEYSCQQVPLSGAGVFVLLEKVQGIWEVVLTRGTWMSKK